MEWIRNCPFCGGRPKTIKRGLYNYFYLECKNCRCRTATCGTKEDAKKLWQMRKGRGSRNDKGSEK